MPRYDARAIIEMWPSRQTLAADIGCSVMAVHHMYSRNSVPRRHHATLALAAGQRGLDVTLADVVSSFEHGGFQAGNSPARVQGASGRAEKAS